VFLCFANLERVVGVELVRTTYDVSAKALVTLQSQHPKIFAIKKSENMVMLEMLQTFDSTMPKRTIEFHRGNLFDYAMEVPQTDVLVLETDIPRCTSQLTELLCKTKTGSRILMYNKFKLLDGYTPEFTKPHEQRPDCPCRICCVVVESQPDAFVISTKPKLTTESAASPAGSMTARFSNTTGSLYLTSWSPQRGTEFSTAVRA
jgi:hypothetical protein